jgi:predicted small secreted protein
MRAVLVVFFVLVCSLVVECQNTQRGFQVQIENLSGGSVLPTAFSPAVWAVFSGQNPLFTTGSLASASLKKFAEDADPSALFSSAQNATGVLSTGVANGGVQPVAGFVGLNGIPIGGSVTFGIRGKPGDKFTFAAQFWESNNDFYAVEGIPLFVNGTPVSGSFPVNLYYAGTEVDETAGAGLYQPPRQQAAGQGQKVSLPVSLKQTGFYLPATSTVIRLTITPVVNFQVRFENLGNGTLFAPAWAVVSSSSSPVFTLGQAASTALSVLATTGDPTQLLTSLSNTPGVIFSGRGSTNNLAPASYAQFTVPAPFGSRLYLAFKLGGYSDRFYSTPAGGLALFNNAGALSSTSVEGGLKLYSKGTVVQDASDNFPSSRYFHLSITPVYTSGTQTTTSDSKFTPAAPNQDVNVALVFTDLISP